MRLDWMTLRVTSVIMAYVKPDQVKRSDNNVEKYRLFIEDKLKLFICKKIRPMWFLTPKDYVRRRNVSFTHTTPINSRGKKQPRGVF